jgi:hypothetical protein
MPWCEPCHNTGEIDCGCGGDLCVCKNYGTYPCPHCEGADRGDDVEMPEAIDDDLIVITKAVDVAQGAVPRKFDGLTYIRDVAAGRK